MKKTLEPTERGWHRCTGIVCCSEQLEAEKDEESLSPASRIEPERVLQTLETVAFTEFYWPHYRPYRPHYSLLGPQLVKSPCLGTCSFIVSEE